MGIEVLGMENMSSGYKDVRSEPPVQESKQVSASGTGPSVGPAGFSVTEKPASGWEGPGIGSKTRMNSDGQMPSSAT